MFLNDLEFGKQGEEKTEAFLIEHGYEIIDVRENAIFQSLDIDFLVKQNNKLINVEVKTDRQGDVTCNIAFEVASNHDVGCLERSKADWVFYYFANTDKLWFIDLKKLRLLIKKKNYEIVPMGDNAKGYLIPLNDIYLEKVGKNVC